MMKARSILAVVIVGGFTFLTLALVIAKLLPEMPSWAQGNLNMVIGAWIANFGTVVGWYYGSSQGSEDKTALLTGKKNDE